MKAESADLVSLAFRAPLLLPAWPLIRWDELVRQARRANLLGRIAAELEGHALLSQVPGAVCAHLDAAAVLSRAHAEAVRREVAHIVRALAGTGIAVTLLKGAGYLMAGVSAANGRLFSDIDILVPEEALAEVEAELARHGWASLHQNAHDQRYYREWMHELPPMQHVHRRTVIDVHHAILPRTARLKPETAKLLAASRPVEGRTHLRVLAPVDMVLHSACHLFHNEEFSNGLRDLVDLHTLLRDFGGERLFWEDLPKRAEELDLMRPLYYGLRYATKMLGTPVPADVISRTSCAAPPKPLDDLLDQFWLRALRPPHSTVEDWLTATARAGLYIRAHWLRMPPRLLVYHLAVKTLQKHEALMKKRSNA